MCLSFYVSCSWLKEVILDFFQFYAAPDDGSASPSTADFSPKDDFLQFLSAAEHKPVEVLFNADGSNSGDSSPVQPSFDEVVRCG